MSPGRQGETEDGISETLEQAAAAAQEWAETNAVTQMTEAILLSRRRKRRTPAAPPPEASRLLDTRSTSTRRQPDGSASGSITMMSG